MSEIHETRKDSPINVIGAGVPGIPLYISGRNDHMAWGITAAHSDTADLYWEIINEENKQYFFDGKWRPLKLSKEKFYIKGQEDPLEFEFMATHKGPLLPEDLSSNLVLFHDFIPEDIKGKEYISFCWSGFMHEPAGLRDTY